MGLNTESDEESIEEDEEEYESIEDDSSNEEEEEDSEEETANLLLQTFTSHQYDQPEMPDNVDQAFGDITHQHNLSPRGLYIGRGRGMEKLEVE